MTLLRDTNDFQTDNVSSDEIAKALVGGHAKMPADK